jgi:hypothetical protein
MAMWTVRRHPSVNRAFAVISDEGAWVEYNSPETNLREVRPFRSSAQAWAYVRILSNEVRAESEPGTAHVNYGE